MKLERVSENPGREPHTLFRLVGEALVYHAMGDHNLADNALREVEAINEPGAFYQLDEICAYRGALDTAFEWLDRSRMEHDSGPNWAKCDPLLRSLHHDPRWIEFLGKIGLAD